MKISKFGLGVRFPGEGGGDGCWGVGLLILSFGWDIEFCLVKKDSCSLSGTFPFRFILYAESVPKSDSDHRQPREPELRSGPARWLRESVIILYYPVVLDQSNHIYSRPYFCNYS